MSSRPSRGTARLAAILDALPDALVLVNANGTVVNANAIAMEIGEYEVLPVVEEVPVICGVHATDPRRRMWHWLGKGKEMGFSGVNNFPTHTIVDGHFRGVLEETGMSVKKEYEMVALARRMDLFSIVYVGSPAEAIEMAKAGADAIIAHVGTTVGGSIGVTGAVVSWDHTKL